MSLSASDGGAQRAPAPTEEAGCGPAAEESFAELYRSESPRLIRMFARRTRSRDDADDLVQDVFFRFARLRDSVSRLEKPRAYLSRIAANLLKDRSKLDARHSVQSHVPANEEMLPGIDQERALEARDMLRRLDAALLQLSPKTREIFIAHRVEGMSYSEIAERTGLKVKRVEKHMSKAIFQLDRILHRGCEG